MSNTMDELLKQAITICKERGISYDNIIEEALALWVEHHSQELSNKYIDKY